MGNVSEKHTVSIFRVEFILEWNFNLFLLFTNIWTSHSFEGLISYLLTLCPIFWRGNMKMSFSFLCVHLRPASFRAFSTVSVWYFMLFLISRNSLGRFSGPSKLLHNLTRPIIAKLGNVYSDEHKEVPKAFFTPHPKGVTSNSSHDHWQMVERIVHTPRVRSQLGMSSRKIVLVIAPLSRDSPSMLFRTQTHSYLGRGPRVLAGPAHTSRAARVFVGPAAHSQGRE
jgi:hypothetical protein